MALLISLLALHLDHNAAGIQNTSSVAAASADKRCLRSFPDRLALNWAPLNSLFCAHMNTIADEYSEAYRRAISYWAKKGPRRVSVMWNPKAPGIATLTMDVFVVVDADTIYIYSAEDRRGFDFMGRFTSMGVTIVDNHTLTAVTLPKIRPSEGGTTTSIPAELFATRLLVLANSLPAMDALLSKEGRKVLSRKDESSLFAVLFPDSDLRSILGNRNDSIGSTVTIGTASGKRNYEWRDAGGVIFQAMTSTDVTAAVQKRARDFAWADKKHELVSRPKLKDLATFFVKRGIIDSIDGHVTAFGLRGKVSAGEQLTPEEVVMEQVRVRIGAQPAVLVVARSAPHASASAESVKDLHGDTVGRVTTSMDVDNMRVFSLVGQEWTIGLTWPGFSESSDEASALVRGVNEYLKGRLSAIGDAK